MNKSKQDIEVKLTDQEGFPPEPTHATIVLRGQDFEAPRNMLDLTIAGLTAQNMSRTEAVGLYSVRLKLYAHKRADLGYGLVATISGHLGG